jgi:hypothetical protein
MPELINKTKESLVYIGTIAACFVVIVVGGCFVAAVVKPWL